MIPGHFPHYRKTLPQRHRKALNEDAQAIAQTTDSEQNRLRQQEHSERTSQVFRHQTCEAETGPDACNQVSIHPGRRAYRTPSSILVRLTPLMRDVNLAACGTLAKLADAAKLTDLGAVIDKFGLTKSRPLVQSLPADKILEMEARAEKSCLPPLRSLTDYWRVDIRGIADRVDAALVALNSVPGVDLAYEEMPVGDPLVSPGDDTYNAQQDYQDAAPDGINARWAWLQPSGEGKGIAVADIEQGWRMAHDDYTAKAPTLIYGDNRDGVGSYRGNHGTAVLGEMIGVDNDRGIVGIAPSAAPVFCSSHFDRVSGTNGHTADAICGALAKLAPGDVMLIEVQTVGSIFGAPAEYADDVFDAIRLASALGIIVFEAAGNGSQNLDTLTKGGMQIFNPASPDFRDSGAIIIGAAQSALPHNRANFSSFGSRVDCFGWGQSVVTTGYGTLDDGGGNPDLSYTDSFSGTSSATPIIAGAGLIVQGMMEANTGSRLSPLQMRQLLSNPATGTPQGPDVAGLIGVMPDLRGVIEDTLCLTPDIYLRDNLGDDGSVPSDGVLCRSPDIIVRQSRTANPQAAYGEGSGVEDSVNLSQNVEEGQDNFLYVRMKNHGAADAEKVRARVFWSPPATLAIPEHWREIGRTDPIDVPRGDVLRVSPALRWQKNDIPQSGHYCFIAMLHHPGDPEPLVPSSWLDFKAFVKNNNNVAWRNFNIVDAAKDADTHGFYIAGAPDQRRRFDLIINQSIAKNLVLELEVPINLVKPFVSGLKVACRFNRKKRTARLQLPRACMLRVPDLVLPAKALFKCNLIIKGLRRYGDVGNRVSIAQLHEGDEVGRITYQIARSER